MEHTTKAGTYPSLSSVPGSTFNLSLCSRAIGVMTVHSEAWWTFTFQTPESLCRPVSQAILQIKELRQPGMLGLSNFDKTSP